MKISEYFKTAKGTGILATADAKGPVDLAIYAKPHVIDDENLAFIMAEKLTQVGVVHRLITLVGKGHGFDYEIESPDVQHAFTDVIQFLGKYLA